MSQKGFSNYPPNGGIKPAVRQNAYPKSNNAQISSKSQKKTVLITYAAYGHAYLLAKHYLEAGHRVIVHCVDPHSEKSLEKMKNTYRKDFCMVLKCSLDEAMVKEIINRSLDKFGHIDVVFHFATALCKPGSSDPDENLRYLFEANVKPFISIAKQLLLLQETSKSTCLIPIGPICPPSVIKESLHYNIDRIRSYLQAAVDELDNISPNFLSRFVSYKDFTRLDFEAPNVARGVCEKLMNIETNMRD